MHRYIYIIIIFLLFIFVNKGKSQEWVVPNHMLNIENPSSYNLQNVKKGQAIYLKNCKSCHGDAGKNNPLPLLPSPPDIATEKMQLNSDGGLFYKITYGRGTMPQFETSLSEDDRWRVINYIRNFSPEYEPLLIDAPKINAKLLGSVNEIEKKIEVFAEIENKNGTYSSLINSPVIINVKKTFGIIKIGEALTNEKGRAVFTIPENTIGNPEGNIDLVISLNEQYKFEQLIFEKANVCKPYDAENLFKETVLWGTNDRLQPWLLFSYLSVAGGAWIAILYVIFQIIKIKRLGRQDTV